MLHTAKISFAFTIALTATSASASDTSSSKQGWVSVTGSASVTANTSAPKASPVDLGRLAALKANSEGTRFSAAKTPARSWQVIVPAKTKMIVIDPVPSSELRLAPDSIPMPIILDDSASLEGATARPKVIPGVYRTVELRK